MWTQPDPARHELVRRATPLIQERLTLLGEAADKLDFLLVDDATLEVDEPALVRIGDDAPGSWTPTVGVLEGLIALGRRDDPGGAAGETRRRSRAQAQGGLRSGAGGGHRPPGFAAAVRVDGDPRPRLLTRPAGPTSANCCERARAGSPDVIRQRTGRYSLPYERHGRDGRSQRFHPRHGAPGHRAGHIRWPGADAVPARTERVPAHRSREGGRRQLRYRRGLRGCLQPASRRHEPRHGGNRVRRCDRRRHRMARLSARGGRARIRLLPQPVRMGRVSGGAGAWPTSTTRTPRRSPSRRAASGVRASRAPIATARSAENLDLLRRMRAGEFADGSRCLRARIDMQAENMWLRDPVMYRIRHAHHHNTGDEWCIYPTYDWAHGQSDAIEGVTHSLCSLEFESHRPLYDWFLAHLPLEGPAPKQKRVRPAGTHPHHHLEASAAQARRGRCRVRVGRPPDAHTARAAPPRLSRRGHPRLLHRHGQHPEQLGQGHRGTRVVRAPRVEPHRDAADGRAASASAHDHQLAGSTPTDVRWWSTSTSSTIPRIPMVPGHARWRSRVGCSSNSEDFAEVPPPKFFRLVARA